MSDNPKLPRRSMLKAAALLAGAAFAGNMVPAEEAFAQTKASKESMKYQDKPNGDKQCDGCLQFVAPDSCKVVAGKIDPKGYCIAWVKKP